MDFETLEIVLQLSNGNSISDVARALFLSQSTVSRKLAVLEKSLGLQLFVRNKGHSAVTLTAMGERFIRIAKKMLELRREALHLKEYSKRARMHIALIDSVAACVFSPYFQQLPQEMPGFELTFSVHQSWEIHDLVRSRTADVGICNYAPLHSDLTSEILFQEEYVVVRKGTAPAGQREDIHPSQLPTEHGIYYSFQIEFDRWHDYWWPPGQAKVCLHATHFLAQIFTGEEDWSVLPLSLARSLPAEEFYTARLSVPVPQRSCYLVLHKDILPHIRQPVEDFCVRLKSYLKAYPNGA